MTSCMTISMPHLSPDNAFDRLGDLALAALLGFNVDDISAGHGPYWERYEQEWEDAVETLSSGEGYLSSVSSGVITIAREGVR